MTDRPVRRSAGGPTFAVFLGVLLAASGACLATAALAGAWVWAVVTVMWIGVLLLLLLSTAFAIRYLAVAEMLDLQLTRRQRESAGVRQENQSD